MAQWKHCAGASLTGVAAFLVVFPSPACAAQIAVISTDTAGAISVLTAGALALAGGLWALSERETAQKLRRALRTATARARALISARDAWLAAGRESLVVWGADMPEPLSFGRGAELMQDCLSGSDAAQLSIALDALTASGTPFALICPTPSGKRIAVRGRPSGGYLTVFFDAESHAVSDGLDFRGALNALPQPMWIRDKDQALTFVNQAFVAASGRSEDEALAGGFAFDRSERELASSALASSEKVVAKRFAILSGQRRALQFTLTPVAGGGVAGTVQDVTDLAEAALLLQRHLDAHADILNQLTTAICIFGEDRRLTFFNHAFVRLWGLSEAWLETHPLHGEVLDRLRELRRLPEQPDFRAWKQQRMKSFERRDRVPEELWHLPTGQTLRVTTQPHPFGGVVVLFDDVSNQVRLEGRYNELIKVQKATLDTLHEGVAVFGPDGKLKLHNAAFARIWQFEPDELSGEPHLKRIAQACASRFGGDRTWDIVLSSVTSASTERNGEWSEIERPDGTIIGLTIAPLPDAATLLSFEDVTDRFHIEAALRERNDALEASDNLKSEFVKRMSYELRTPLNSIVGFAEMMRTGMTGSLNPKQTEYVEAMATACNQLRNLVNDVLDLSQIEAGTMELELENLDLFLLLFGVAEHARDWSSKVGLSLKLDCTEESGLFVADARRVKQVILNLLSNAFKYTPRGGSVTLGGEIIGEDARIWVQDTGPGVPSEFMPSAFGRFTAKGNAVGRPGAGLGLALVNRFVELHGGWVELESRNGQGTRVTCHLPRNLGKQRPKRPEVAA